MSSPDPHDPRTPVYEERNRLVALLAAIFPSSRERHPEDDMEWEDDWRWVIFVQLPTGQCSWHIHDSHLPLFAHVPEFKGMKWDGHTTQEKYERVARMHSRPKALVASDPVPVCGGCKNEIDPDVCHCGTEKAFHDPMEMGHTLVPAGCTCGYYCDEDAF